MSVDEIGEKLKRTVTDHEAAQIIEQEGIGYAVCHYMDADNLKNPETEELWNHAEIALKNLAEHLGCESY